MSRHPEVKWAEREEIVYLTILLPDAKNPKVNVDPDGTFTFSATAGTDNNLFELNLSLLEKINAEGSKINIGVRSIICILKKAEKKWWKKLLRGDGKAPHYLKVDWDKWADEDDDTGAPAPGDFDMSGMDFSKFGGMGGLGDNAMEDDLEDSDDEEFSKPDEKDDDQVKGEHFGSEAKPTTS